MNDFINNLVLGSNWFFFGTILAIAVPAIVIFLNEAAGSSDKKSGRFSKPIQAFKNIILPFGAALIILTQMLDFERSNTVIKVLETILWILIINSLIALVNSFYFRIDENGVLKSKMPQLFMDILRVALVLLGAAIVLSTVWGADLSGLITALGLGSFVLGLALQDTLGNLFSGIALVYEKPFREGDVIEMDDTFGKVIEMNWRAIRLETIRGDMVVIPHLVIGQAAIKNYNEPARAHYMTFEIGFDYHLPPNKIKEVLTPICLATPGVLSDPPPAVKVIEFKESVVLYEVEYAIDDFWLHEEIMDDLMTRCWYAMRRNKLAVPVSQWVDHFPYRGLPKDYKAESELDKVLEMLPSIFPIRKENTKYLRDGVVLSDFGVDEFVIRQGGKSGKIFLILEGNAELIYRDSEGIDSKVAQLEKGDVIGEITLFSGKKNTFSAKAVTDLRLLEISSEEVPDMIEKDPKLARHLDEMMDMRRSVLRELEQPQEEEVFDY